MSETQTFDSLESIFLYCGKRKGKITPFCLPLIANKTLRRNWSKKPQLVPISDRTCNLLWRDILLSM